MDEIKENSIRAFSVEKPEVRGISDSLKKRIEAEKSDPEFLNRVNKYTELLKVISIDEAAELIAYREKEAHEDPMLGILSRNGFIDHSTESLKLVKRVTGELGMKNYILYGDVDGLKNANHEGREVGNKLLINIADIMNRNKRDGDITGRVGGDEMATLLINAPYRDVIMMHNKIQEEIDNLKKQGSIPGYSGASFGWVELGSNESIESCLVRADKVMEKAKDAKTKIPGERGGHIVGLIELN